MLALGLGKFRTGGARIEERSRGNPARTAGPRPGSGRSLSRSANSNHQRSSRARTALIHASVRIGAAHLVASPA
jgi:hypothetical protein